MIGLSRAGIVLGVVLALTPSLGAADESSRVAMEHFRKGTLAYDLGHFTEAAAEYELPPISCPRKPGSDQEQCSASLKR